MTLTKALLFLAALILNAGIAIIAWLLWKHDSEALSRIAEFRKTAPIWLVSIVIVIVIAIIRVQVSLPNEWSQTLMALGVLTAPYILYFVNPSWGALPRAPFLILAALCDLSALYYASKMLMIT
jgi:hypothetical protein